MGGAGGNLGMTGGMGVSGSGGARQGSPGAPGMGATGTGTRYYGGPNRGGDGGAGAGGGILFKITPGLVSGPQVVIDGIVDNYGGLGATNGGTFKCFYANKIADGGTINTGRKFYKKVTRGVIIT